MYNQVILKDKADITPMVKQRLQGASVLGAYEKPNIPNTDDIKVLSVKFSKVGKTTFERYKNLEWVVCRSHGIDMVNEKECKKRNIGIVALSPTAKPCATWIHDKIEKDEDIIIFGNGSIARELQKKIGNFNVVNSKTSQEEIDRYLKFSKTIVNTLPLNTHTKNYFNRQLFSKINHQVDIISLSRGEVIDNDALLDFNTKGYLNRGIFDMLVSSGRDVLVKQKNIRYTEHTAWSYNQPMEKGKLGGYVNREFADNLKEVIDGCLQNKIEFPHLPRHDNVWF